MDVNPNVVNRFRGLRSLPNIAVVPFDCAVDLLNVIPSIRGLSKMRDLRTLSPALINAAVASGPIQITDFQSPTLRQWVVQVGNSLYYIDPGTYAATLISTDATYADQFRMQSSSNILFMANGSKMLKWLGGVLGGLQTWGISKPAVAPTLGAVVAGAITFTQGGRRYRVARKNSVTQHEGTASDISNATGNLAAQNQNVSDSNVYTDPQLDTWVWYATTDGGSIYIFHSETATAALLDSKTDLQLIASSRRAQLINDPPLPGYYVKEFMGRIYVFRLVADKSGIIYSGYEKIYVGRPEESFPPGNRLRLSIGADAIAGGGVIQQGVVAFSESDEMYMFRGTVTDVTTTDPVAFSAVLEKLPWGLGCYSHDTIDSDEDGLWWYASDGSIRAFTGSGAPLEVSFWFQNKMQEVTPGYQQNAKGCIFNWMDRDWYVLALPVKGATYPNRLIIVDKTTEPAEENYGAFICDFNKPIDFVTSVEDNQRRRRLLVGSEGYLKEIVVEDDARNGVRGVVDPAVDGLTILPAYYRTGYHGGDTPTLTKFYRDGRLRADVDGFKVGYRYTDEDHGLSAPVEVPAELVGSQPVFNVKATRLGWDIYFPDSDVPAHVQEIATHWQSRSIRRS